MATIRERKGEDGITYQVQIRNKNISLCKSFKTKEDAEIFAFYKDRLINLMDNFDIPIEKRITIHHVIEIKMKQFEGRTLLDFQNSLNKLDEYIPKDKFCHEVSFEDWLNIAKSMYESDVYRGAKTENGKRKMSPSTLRRYFATISSAFSHAQSIGIPVDNHPLKVIQSYITPLLKDQVNL